MVVILYGGKTLLACWWVLTASVVVIEEGTRGMCKYSRTWRWAKNKARISIELFLKCLPRLPTSQPLDPNNLLGLVQFHHLPWLPGGLY